MCMQACPYQSGKHVLISLTLKYFSVSSDKAEKEQYFASLLVFGSE